MTSLVLRRGVKKRRSWKFKMADRDMTKVLLFVVLPECDSVKSAPLGVERDARYHLSSFEHCLRYSKQS